MQMMLHTWRPPRIAVLRRTRSTTMPASGRHEAVHPGKGRPEQPELDRRQVHLALEERKDGEDRLTVGVVEDADRPEHEDDPPLVPGTVGAHWVESLPHRVRPGSDRGPTRLNGTCRDQIHASSEPAGGACGDPCQTGAQTRVRPRPPSATMPAIMRIILAGAVALLLVSPPQDELRASSRYSMAATSPAG